MKKNKIEEVDNIDTNIIVISFIDLMKKLISGIDEEDDVVKQLKTCDLKYFDKYANYYYKYWSEIGRPFNEDL